MATLSLQHVAKSFGDQLVIDGVDLEVGDGELVVLVGPSGCGKSTLLRMIAGLEEVSGGTVHIAERDVTNTAPAKRGVAMVFQTYALYPHMSVYKNMAFGLKQAKTPTDEIDRRVREAAEVLQITELLERRPKALSGGQRQRVAIGRAIVREPDVFLFDEPLSNLDAALRVQTRLEIARLHQSLDATMVYVTHDQVEAMTLADRIVVLRDGRVEQVGTPIELYNQPDNMFVAGFIGSPKMNFISPEDLSPNPAPVLREIDREGCVLGIRPEHLSICKPDAASIEATLELVEHLGEYVLVHLKTRSGDAIIVKSPVPPEFSVGDTVPLMIDLKHIHAFDKSSETRI